MANSEQQRKNLIEQAENDLDSVMKEWQRTNYLPSADDLFRAMLSIANSHGLELSDSGQAFE